MTPLNISWFRRLTFALVTLLFAGLAFNSIASADFGMVKTKYKVKVSGSYNHKWQQRLGDYPDPEAPWSDAKGKVTSTFSTKRPWKFVAARFTKPPPGMEMPPFSVGATDGNSLKSINFAEAKASVNYVAGCGGELGECQGDEREGTETSNKSCRKPNSKIPLSFDFDEEGYDSMLKFDFGQHRTMAKFCGDDFFYKNSIERLPLEVKINRGLDRMKNLRPGGSFTWKDSFEEGWVGDGADDGYDRYVKKCPKLGGKGTRHCWKTKLRVDVRRVL